MLTPKLVPIASDFRGESWSLLLPDGTEGVLIFTRKGMYRGGHSHNKAEVSLVLSGKMLYRKLIDGKEFAFEQNPGELLHNNAGHPHLALALEEGWLFDWKLKAKKGETVTTNYPRYRIEVDNQRQR